MISKFSLPGNPKKALCGVFCERSISEFNNSWNLDERDFVWLQEWKKCIGVSSCELHKEQRGEETFYFYLSMRSCARFYIEICVG